MLLDELYRRLHNHSVNVLAYIDDLASHEAHSSCALAPKGDDYREVVECTPAPRAQQEWAFLRFPTRRAFYRVLGRHEVAQEPSGSSAYTVLTTFWRAPNRPIEDDGATGVRPKLSTGRLVECGLAGLNQVRRSKERKVSQRREPCSRRRPRGARCRPGGIGLALTLGQG